MINCIIVDDEQHAIDILVHYINQTPSLHLVGSTTNPVEGLQMVVSNKIDLVFLDIQMPELSGIDFIKAISGRCRVILTTAYSEFALQGYDLEVTDYLLKPIRFPRFLAAVQKVSNALTEITEETAEDDFIFVKTESKGKLLKINLPEIDYIEGMKNYVAIHTGGKSVMVYASLKDMEEKLPHKQFLRIHKSFIIPVTKITGIEGNHLMLKGVPQGIMIGESYRAELMEIISHKMIQ